MLCWPCVPSAISFPRRSRCSNYAVSYTDLLEACAMIEATDKGRQIHDEVAEICSRPRRRNKLQRVFLKNFKLRRRKNKELSKNETVIGQQTWDHAPISRRLAEEEERAFLIRNGRGQSKRRVWKRAGEVFFAWFFSCTFFFSVGCLLCTWERG